MKSFSSSQSDDLSDFEAVAIAEGNLDMVDRDMTPDLAERAWQHLIDTGLAWRLQGWFGRRAADLIAAGICHQ